MFDQDPRHSQGDTPTRVMTVNDVADYLHLHPSTVYRLVKSGQIPAFRFGGRWRFNIESIDEWRIQKERN